MFGENQKEQRPSGRRHETNEVTSNDGIPSYYTTDAAVGRRVDEETRNKNIENMSNGPSFLDRMGDGSRAAEAPRRTSQSRSPQLNLFQWNDDKSPAQQPPAHRGSRLSPSDGALPPRVPVSGDSEARRTSEASKFEKASHSSFLNFESKTEEEKKEARRASLQATRNTSFSGSFNTNNKNEEKQGSFMDGFHQETEKPHGRRRFSQPVPESEQPDQLEQTPPPHPHGGRKHLEPPEPARAAHHEEQAAETPVHLSRKRIVSNVFPQGVLGATEQQYDPREVDGQLVFGTEDTARPADVCPTPASETAPSQASCDAHHVSRRGSKPGWQQRSSLKFGAAGLGSYE